MAYTINKYNGDCIVSVADGTVDNTLSIKMPGKNYAGYGEILNENFVFLLENFSRTTSPDRPIAGQLWYDSSKNKIRVYDGSRFKSVGAEVNASVPTGLTTGDLWYDCVNRQMYAYDSNVPTTSLVLIGPQSAAGLGETIMKSVAVRDIDSNCIPIIEGVICGNTVVTISNAPTFQLHPDESLCADSRFTTIHPGLTLSCTNSSGVSLDNYRYWGTASDADNLGGYAACNYIRKCNNRASFLDQGYTVGTTIDKLLVFIDTSDSCATVFQNLVCNNVMKFKTTGTSTYTPMVLSENSILPGVCNTTNIGSSSYLYNTVYATTFCGTATQANTLKVGTSYYSTSSAATACTVPVRTDTGAICASVFCGTASVVCNGVYTTGDQTIAGTKTFSSTIVGSISGNAGTVTNGVYTTGDQTIAGTKTFSSTIVGSISGNAGTVTNGVYTTGTQTIGGIKNFTNPICGSITSVQVTNVLADANTYYPVFTTCCGAVPMSVDTTGLSYTPSTNTLTASYFNGIATSAYYADLAEKYLADSEYEVGTVVIVGGEKEVTASSSLGQRGIGVVSENPAFKMNSGLEDGTYIALKGRVPVKVQGLIKRGYNLIAAPNGCAIAIDGPSPNVFAIALEDKLDSGVGLIEAIIL